MTLRSSHFPAVAMKYICMLAAGFCERWTKAWRGWICARPRAAFDCGKKLAANVSSAYAVELANTH